MPLTLFGDEVFDSDRIVGAVRSTHFDAEDKEFKRWTILLSDGSHVMYRNRKHKLTYDAVEAWMNTLPNPLKK